MKTIIVADDDKNRRKTIVSLIKHGRKGIRVIEVSNGKDLVEKVNTEEPTLVFTDNVMPEMDGLEAIKKIRESDERLLIYMISGGDVEKEAKEAGVTGYLHSTEYTKKLNEILNQYL